MAKRKNAAAGWKKKVDDLPVKDVETAEARVITGGADGKAAFKEIQVIKVSDTASVSL